MNELLNTPEPPALGPERRASSWSEAVVDAALQRELCAFPVSEEAACLLQCVILLWHDHLEAAHRIAQGIETPDGSWMHGIMHRREPDYGNAKYWFHRTGQHPAFAELALRAKPMFAHQATGNLGSRLVKAGTWDPFAFVDAVEAARARDNSPTETEFLRQLQAKELETAFDHFLARGRISLT